MKTVRRISLFLIIAMMVTALFSCGGSDPCTTCVDSDSDGKCDVCGEDMPTTPCERCVDGDSDGKCDVCGGAVTPIVSGGEIALISGGNANFQIVVATGTSTKVRSKINAEIIEKLKTKSGINITLVNEGSNTDKNPKTVEVLIGGVSTRGSEYKYDEYKLGLKGYVIKVEGTKVIIDAVSDDALIDAIEIFAEDILKTDTASLTEAKISVSYLLEEIQDDYDVTALKLGGEDMKGYVIATDLTNSYYKAAAELLRDEIYEETGYWLPTASDENAPAKAILIKSVNKVFSSDSFKVSESEGKLVIECAFDNMIVEAMDEFIEEHIDGKTGEVNFEGDAIFKKDISVVCYDDFGAVGDGVTDDFMAFYNTHVFANECGQKVVATAGKNYLLRDNKVDGTVTSIIVRTSVDFKGATVTIDDTLISGKADDPYYEYFNVHMFDIRPNEEHEKVRIDDPEALAAILAAGLNKNTTVIDLPLEDWDGHAMIIPYNSDHKVFRRKGSGQHTGDPMKEVIVLDANGNVNKKTPLMFHYTNLTYVDVYKIDFNDLVTFENATMVTLASQVNNCKNGVRDSTQYIKRGLNVSRSWTTVKNIKHVIQNEFTHAESVDKNGVYQKMGHQYYGFFSAEYASNITFKKCEIPARKCYGHSSYNLRVLHANAVVFDECVQTNFWVTIDENNKLIPSSTYTPGAVTSMSTITLNGKNFQMHWGVGGSNYSKNLEYKNSTLSRFDAHAGLYNGAITNSTINAIELTGVGTFKMTNVNWHSDNATQDSVVGLRTDYGTTWDGEVIMKDVNLYVEPSARINLVSHTYQNWYYGYTCAFPSVSVDSLSVYNRNTRTLVPDGHELYLTTFSSSRMHLKEADRNAIIAIADLNDDGYIDEPIFDSNLDGLIDASDLLDIDGNGVKGETSLKYDEIIAQYPGVSYRDGRTLPTKYNVCIVKPPEYIKVVNNTRGYKINVFDTSLDGVSDGGWYRDASLPDTMGGFYGGTKFYYGNGTNDYFVGTAPASIPSGCAFKFIRVS